MTHPEKPGNLPESRPDLGCSSSGYCFLFRGALCAWQPHSWGFRIILEDDISKAQRCEENLRRAGLSFETIEELVSHAHAAGWPEWDRIADAYTAPNKHAGNDGPDETIVS